MALQYWRKQVDKYTLNKNAMEIGGEGCAQIIVFVIIVSVCGFAAWLFNFGFWGGLFLVFVLSVVAFSGMKKK